MLDASHFLVRSLLEDHQISEQDVSRAQEHAKANECDLVSALVSIGATSSRNVALARAKLCEYPFVDLSTFDVDFANAQLMPRSVGESLVAFPLFIIGERATVAMLDPLNLQALDQVRQMLKRNVDPVLCDEEQLRSLITRAYSLSRTPGGSSNARVEEADSEDLTTGSEPIVAAVNQILAGAVEADASDIHISPDEHELHLRYRVDGVLCRQQGPGRAAHAGLVQRLKVMAKLDLTQTRRPQDGKFRFVHRGRAVDVRLSLIPTIHGENVVMRLLKAAASIGGIETLGMPARIAGEYEEAVTSPHGMILVTGPTGSGKTTTLYTALNHINDEQRNIMTIEDPVEIRLPLIRQVQANAEVGLTFASALRSILRQDPDVILVGEIRDEETAQIAVQAALTGHLVFSTLHTNSAVGAVPRLADFGLPAFAINSALLCVIAQRLVRTVCEECAQPAVPDESQILKLGLEDSDTSGIREGAGCPACQHTGYKGRAGVYELLRMTSNVQRAVERGASVNEVQDAANLDGFEPMWRDGLEKVLDGRTTMSELVRLVVQLDNETETSKLRMSA